MPSLTPTSWRETKIPNRTKFGLLCPGDRYKCRHGIGNQRKRQEIFVKLRFMIETYWKTPLHDQNKIILRIILKRLILVQKGHTISRELENRHENNNSNTSLQTLTGKMTRAKNRTFVRLQDITEASSAYDANKSWSWVLRKFVSRPIKAVKTLAFPVLRMFHETSQ